MGIAAVILNLRRIVPGTDETVAPGAHGFAPKALWLEAEEIVRKALAEFERKVRRAKTRKKLERVVAEQIPALRPEVADSFISPYTSNLLDVLQAYMTHDATKADILTAIGQAEADEEEDIAVMMMLWN